MAKYELVVIYDPYLQEADYETQIGKVKDGIAKRGGNITNVDIWGRRMMAYPIKKKPEGHYVIFCFDGEVEAAGLAEIERGLRLNEAVLREMLVKIPPPKKVKPSKKKVKPAAAETERRVFAETRSAGDAGAAITED